ncbi:calcium/sodium antiporter [archaeon]|nr:calcium/sodium antiporter [archaeon]MBT3577177.1 calcium/sodium antiporter [archaeon]MBT6820116.1 calcium/sodium antiporter [archaeon]MBT6956360.1 calcium/sodium antiporter [archaeon]MBT7025467.1 calcium/sodium antiporter [archaeon]
MVIEYSLLVLGIVFLIFGAKLIIDGSSSLAKKFNISTLVIGLTIVAFGTSLPELVVNVFAALEGSSGVALGNIIGSNIANILLVLGLVVVITPVKVKYSTTWKEIPFSFLAIFVLFLLSNYFFFKKSGSFFMTRASGVILLLFFAAFMYYVVRSTMKHKAQPKNKELEIPKHNNFTITLMIILGLVGLYYGGQWVVGGAVFIAKQFGLSEFLISATVIAIGTSLPELVTGVTAALKHDLDLAVGNSIGSNIFNVLWILGITALIAPVLIPKFINFDMIFLMGITALLFLFMFIGKKRELGRFKGITMIILYISYLVIISTRG